MDDPYRVFNEAVVKATQEIYERGPLARLGGGPQDVAHTIERAITSRKPQTRYLVTPSAFLLVALRRVFPDRLWDRVVHTQYPQPQ